MRSFLQVASALAMAAALGLSLPLEAAPISKAVQQACRDDYRKFCSEYGLETAALRICMDRAGHRLSKGCVNALIDAGEVSRAEVERRKRAGR